ncbi:hypothetical protein GCM10023318_61880 [Nocardia callitridis]|uniref:Carrier domain-containing protein n=1 Tax=Nocardia callitridis TaxID=648753 RepID=A0ABP9L6Q2_9NOCA
MSGTNAHIILEQAPETTTPVPSQPDDTASGWLVTANTEVALRRQARGLAEHVRTHPEIDVASAATTLATGRARLARRAVVIGRTAEEFAQGLAALADDAPTLTTTHGTARPRNQVAFVYPGHGSQWAGMAATLLDSVPVFADTVHRCAQALAPHLDWDVVEFLRSGEGSLPGRTNVEFDQPTLWAVMMGLTALWESVGVSPDLVIGHSQGEVAAACAAGILSLEEGARIVAVRSRLLARLVGRGAMASLALPRERAEVMLRAVTGVDIATVNGTEAVVVSGDADGIEALIAACEAEGIRAKRLNAELAGHSPVIDAVAEEMRSELGEVALKPAVAKMISTVTGEQVRAEELDGAHWFRNLREPVLFHTAASAALADGCDVFVEVSPHPVLVGPLTKTIETSASPDAVVTGTLRRDEGDVVRFLQSAAELEVSGVRVDWSASAPTGAPVALPTYDFERRRFWLDGTVALPTVTSVSGAAKAGDDDGTPAASLAALPQDERLDAVRALVRAQVRTVLRLEETDDLDVESPLKELGFESVSAVDLTKRLGKATGLRLSSTLAFEYPTPEEISAHICGLLGKAATPGVSVLLDQLESALLEGQAGEETLTRVRRLLAGVDPTTGSASEEPVEQDLDLDAASDDELFDIVDVGRNL